MKKCSVFLDGLDALFLDAAGTLLRPAGGVAERYAAVAGGLGVHAPADQVGRCFRAAFGAERDAARAQGRLAYGQTLEEGRAFWRRVVTQAFAPWCSDPLARDRIFDRLFAHFEEASAWEVFSDVWPLLRAARERAIPVVVVSNWDARLPRVLDVVGIGALVDHVVGSFEVGVEKPDPRIFEVALERAGPGVDRRRVLHVGDTPDEDVAGAAAAGIPVMLLDRRRDAAPGGRRIVTLAALVERQR